MDPFFRHIFNKYTGIYIFHFLRYPAQTITDANCAYDIWLGCLAFVPDGCSKPRADSGPNRPPLRLGNLRVGELHFCPLCTALDQASSLSRKLAYVPGPTFGFVKLLASSGSHCTK